MDFGINTDFTIPHGGSHLSAFQDSMEEVDMAEEMG